MKHEARSTKHDGPAACGAAAGGGVCSPSWAKSIRLRSWVVRSSSGFRHSPFLLAALFSLATHTPAREWKDAASGRTVEAEMLGIEQGRAVVVLASKQRFGLPIAKLSATDQDWLKTWATGKSPAQLLPPPAWPPLVQQPAVSVKGGPQADGSFAFRSPHYEFNCDAEVSVSVMNDFATVAEGTIRLLYALPVAFPPLEGKTFQARILASRENYAKAGGPEGSAGVFISGSISGEGVLLVPFESLGIERFLGRNTKGYDYDATVLIHEMAHQVTAELLPLMPRWMAEGIAEYAATMPYRNGVFQLGERERALALRQRLEFYQQFSRNQGVNVSGWVMRPGELVRMDDNAWNTANRSTASLLTLHRLYLSSMFLVHYYLHYADNGDARRIRLYFQTLGDAATYIRTKGREGEMPDEIVRNRNTTIEDVRAHFLRQLFVPEDLPALDGDFRAKHAALGFRW